MGQQGNLNAAEIKKKINDFHQRVFVSSAPKKQSASHSVGVIITVLSDLIGGLLVGSAIGWLLYRYAGAHILVLFLFVLIGGFAGLLNVYKSLERLSKGADK